MAEELARFNAFNRVNAATSLQLHFARADTLAHDEVFAGDPGSLRDASQRGPHSHSRRRPGRGSTIPDDWPRRDEEPVPGPGKLI